MRAARRDLLPSTAVCNTDRIAMEPALHITPRRVHLTRLMAIWRSAVWPCRDAVELDLVAGGWATLSEAASGHETIRLTETGIRLLADARQRN